MTDRAAAGAIAGRVREVSAWAGRRGATTLRSLSYFGTLAV